MAENTKLYDLRDCDFPVDQAFRTLQVFKCHVCGALSNLAWWSSCHWGGAANECPNEKADWHWKLQDMRHQLAKSHPKSYKKELRREIKRLLRKVDVRNDLVGSPDHGYEARAEIQTGFIVDGVGIRHGGTMLIADEPIQPPYPPLEEAVFAKFSKDLPSDIGSDLRKRIPVNHRLRVALLEAGNGDADAVSRLQEEGNRLASQSLHEKDPEREDQISRLTIEYGFAYQQWRAEQRLAKAREERSRSSEH